MKKLGVNIDHVATLRNARGISYPKPLLAALYAEEGGADNVTCHLREDRRHIRDEDVLELKRSIATPLNLEMAVTDEMVRFACEVQPAVVTLVPEKREELTTEGGLNVIENEEKIKNAIELLKKRSVAVSLFIDADIKQVEKALKLGAQSIEIHTGTYCNQPKESQSKELDKIFSASVYASQAGLEVHAGHGLHYQNIFPLLQIPDISSFQIGHSIIARAVFVGMKQAVREMKTIIESI
jgi:pyridoxine 5-phosphate synthase